MAPKIKISREHIIEKSVELVRLGGEDALNARSIAQALGCSTQPLFSNFESMEQLQSEVISAAYKIYLDFIKKEVERGRYPTYKAYGRAYVGFAEEERELFKLLFMRDRSGEDKSPSPDFCESVKMISEANGIDEENAMLVHLEMWSCVHGIATMIATSFLELDEELISRILSDVYLGVRARYISGEEKNGRD